MDNYNIDDILSEVKKRRKENEKEQDAAKLPEPDQEDITPENSVEEAIKEKEETAVFETAQQQEEDELQPKEDPVPEDKTENAQSPVQTVEVEADDSESNIAEAVPEDTAEPAQEVKEAGAQKADDEAMVNIFDITEDGGSIDDSWEPTPEQKKAKSKKTAKIIIIVLVILIVIAGIVAAVFVNNSLNKITDNNGKEPVTEEKWDGMGGELEEKFNPIDETDASELASFEDMIKTWYYNGEPVKSNHIMNVLLVGEDTRGDEILDEGTRADSAIIVSVNIDTKQIHMTSVLRDTWAYWETKEGDESTGQFGKINGAMSSGDINTYISCIEHLYKITIEDYVIVNFSSFEDIVDSLGGVTLELTAREINEINNHQKRYGNVTIEKTFEGNSGKVKLDGKQALAYCRIRKIDSDNKRADRQKTCLMEIFNQTKDASNTKLLKVVSSLIPYVKTGFSKSEILQIGKYAFSQGWLGYDFKTKNIPESRNNLKGAGGNFRFAGGWIWKCDYPQDAYNLQMWIYGKSNITLAKNRVDFIKCAETGFFKQGAPKVASSAVMVNDHYGEVTTLPAEKDEDGKTK